MNVSRRHFGKALLAGSSALAMPSLALALRLKLLLLAVELAEQQRHGI